MPKSCYDCRFCMEKAEDFDSSAWYGNMCIAMDRGWDEDRAVDYPDMRIGKAIKNGIPLPKRHGRLVDADAMINKLCTSEASKFFESVTCSEIIDFINDEEPIVKADKPKRRKGVPLEENERNI